MGKMNKSKNMKAAAYSSEHASEEAQQHALAAQEKATRTKMSVGQSKTMRVKRMNANQRQS